MLIADNRVIIEKMKNSCQFFWNAAAVFEEWL